MHRLDNAAGEARFNTLINLSIATLLQHPTGCPVMQVPESFSALGTARRRTAFRVRPDADHLGSVLKPRVARHLERLAQAEAEAGPAATDTDTQAGPGDNTEAGPGNNTEAGPGEPGPSGDHDSQNSSSHTPPPNSDPGGPGGDDVAGDDEGPPDCAYPLDHEQFWPPGERLPAVARFLGYCLDSLDALGIEIVLLTAGEMDTLLRTARPVSVPRTAGQVSVPAMSAKMPAVDPPMGVTLWTV